VPGRAARISGSARDAQGRPLQNVSLEQSFRGPTGASFRSAGNSNVAPDGSFTIRNVPPGEYTLRGSSVGSSENARLPIVVSGDDLDGNRQRWSDGSRWVASARPDQGGRYQFRGLPAGAYLAIALEYVEDGNWNDPAYLESIRDRAERFVLEEASAQTLSLKMVRP
jgi:hypothetical protein